MTDVLKNIVQTILFLGGLCVVLSLAAWVISIICYIIYVIKEC